ncbi:two-component hybrid sensor and regulator [Hyphomicrobium sulfonivorans]|uniref:histidine kinase n=1 Tax=Hyphomicrobium sulfonivorans TaxID=121290 RepID=A0A120CTV3_HYPSL|nr:PAS domain S-box protein [Hyphomicrobium sulfonivorans]KWT65262.1 two-component hybrid sensor and regulator [Hyphomicrobium sulfonivorans]
MPEQTDKPVPSDQKTELQIAEQQISTILAIAADAIISLNEQMRIMLFNDGAAAMFGYTKDEIIGQPLDNLIPDRFRPLHKEHVAVFSASRVAARRMGERQEIFARRKDGSEFPAEASIAKQEIDGQRVFMVVVRDVTERKRAQAELARANSQLEERVAERTRALEAEIKRREEAHAALIQAQRMEAFGQLTGGVAHDFNNLLTIISGNLELLGSNSLEPNSKTLLKRAGDAADMGAALTKRLLTFARRRSLSPQVLDLNELVLGLMEILKRSIGEPITLSTMLAGKLWTTRVDPSEVENAILNLAINARDAMPTGGELLIETRNVEGSELPFDGGGRQFVMLSVSDSGDGMPPDIIERAFEPFFTTKEPGRGTGLGLSTVYGFAQQSDGHAAIESTPGRGTTVRLYLPRADAEKSSVALQSAEAVPMSEASEIILVVEDNADVREVTMQRVEGLGYVALEAESGPAAISLLRSGEHVDLVLSDIVMAGGMSGYDVASWVREHTPHIKVVLTTGYAAEEARHAPWEAGSGPILRKPYKRAQLATALYDALHRTDP